MLCVGAYFVVLLSTLALSSTAIPCNRQVTVRVGDSCWQLVNDNQLPSVDFLKTLNPDLNCDKLQPGQLLCIEVAKCSKIVKVKSGDSCWGIANANGISVTELQSFAESGSIDCNKLQVGQEICVKRGGTGNVNTGESGKKSCKSVKVKAGDSCWGIANSNGISVGDLERLNAGLNCASLQIGQEVCVQDGENKLAPTTSTTKAPSTKPTQSQPINNSYKFVYVKSGDTCWALASSNGLQLHDLYQLNPNLDCGKLSPGDKVCIGNDTSTESPPCDKIVVQSGDTCWAIITKYNITQELLSTLNPRLDCNRLIPGQPLCIAESLPNNTNCQNCWPTILTNCKTVHLQETKLTCAEIASKFNLTINEISQLNPNFTGCVNTSYVLPLGRSLCVRNFDSGPPCLNTFTIKSGDTCWSIRVTHRLSEREFDSLNPNVNCTNLIPGNTMCVANDQIAGEECQLTMAAQRGDTCGILAGRAGLSVQGLQALNPRSLNCDKLEAGQAVCVVNDQRLKAYETSDTGPTKSMLESTVKKLLGSESTSDSTRRARFQNYLDGKIDANEIVADLSSALDSPTGMKILNELHKSNTDFQNFDAINNDHRRQLCQSLQDSTYKSCICNFATPFLYCQAKLLELGKISSRKKRDVAFSTQWQNVTQLLHRYKRRAGGGGKPGVGLDNPLQGILNTFCGNCLPSDTACIDVDVCAPAFVVLEVCLGAGFCVPNPVSLVESEGHLTTTHVKDSRVGIDLSLCIVVINEILKFFGADACIAKGEVDYFYLKQQLIFQGTVSLLVIRGIIKGRVQVAEPYSEQVYDPEQQKLVDDMCTEKSYTCEDFCQVPPGDVFLEWKVEGWFFGWHQIGQGSKNDPPPCKPKPKKIIPPVDSLNKIVLYATSWAQYRAFNATVDGTFYTRPDSCKPHARTPKDVDPSLVTHLNYAFLILDETTFEVKNFERNDDELIAEMKGLKGKNGDLKIMVSIGGWSFSQGETALGESTKLIFANMARTAESRSRFVQSIVNYVKRNGLDGIDIDWEYPLPEDRQSFTDLLRDLRDASQGSDLLLSFAAPAGRKWYSNIDLAEVHQYVDFINLMTYDFHGGSFETGKPPNVNAPIVDCSCPDIEDIELGLEAYLAAGVPAEKINLGLATYGRTFTLDDSHGSRSDSDTLRSGSSTGPGKQGVCTLTPGVLSFYEIKELASADTFQVDRTLMAAYARFSTDQWVGFDTTETLDMKMCFARRKRLGGVMIWDAEMDDHLELVKHIKSKISSGCDSFVIPDCPSGSRKKRAAIRPSRTKPTKKPGRDPECDRIPKIKNQDGGAMKKCKGAKPGTKCSVVCKKNYKATKDDVICKKVGLKRGIWNTDGAECELESTDCGSRPYPIIRVTETTGGNTLYYTRFDPSIKLPIWSLYAQKKFTKSGFERVKPFKRHDCYTTSQFLTTEYNGAVNLHRGHLAPQDAFSFSRQAMKGTNYMLNVAPQDGSTNSGIWETLESKVRDFLQRSPGFVVTGICTRTKKIGRLPVPNCYWKMICTKTTKGTTTVGVFYHENTKVADLSKRRAEVRKVRDQSFVLTLVSGPGRSLPEIWTTALKLTTTVTGLPNPAECGASTTFGGGGVGDLWPANKNRGPGDDQEDLQKFWEDNISSDKFGRKWDFDYPEEEPFQDEDEKDSDDEEDEGDNGDDDDDDETNGAGGNVLSGTIRNRCGHEIKY